MTANVGIAERADRLLVALVATFLVGLGVSVVVLDRRPRDCCPSPASSPSCSGCWRSVARRWPRTGRRTSTPLACRRREPRRDDLATGGLRALAARRPARASSTTRRAGWRRPGRPSACGRGSRPYARCRRPPRTGCSTSSRTCRRAAAARVSTGSVPNYARVRPELGDRELDALVQAGMRSYMRYYCDSFRLVRPLPGRAGGGRPHGSATNRCARPLAAGAGCVVFLGHTRQLGLRRRLVLGAPRSGHHGRRAAGAGGGLPRLRRVPGVARDDDHPAHRRRRPVRRPEAAHRPRGAFVALLADRDLTHNGVEVDLFGHRARMAGPGGAAVMTKAPLFTATSGTRTRPTLPSGKRVVIQMIPVPTPGRGHRPGTRSQVMTQAWPTSSPTAIARHPEDWHMLQRIFVDDLDDRAGRDDRRARRRPLGGPS